MRTKEQIAVSIGGGRTPWLPFVKKSITRMIKRHARVNNLDFVKHVAFEGDPLHQKHLGDVTASPYIQNLWEKAASGQLLTYEEDNLLFDDVGSVRAGSSGWVWVSQAPEFHPISPTKVIARTGTEEKTIDCAGLPEPNIASVVWGNWLRWRRDD